MKKLTTVSLFIFWAVVTAIMTAGFIYYQNSKNSNATLLGDNQVNTLASNLPTGTLLNIKEISKHNSAKDCWLLINNKVYNVTSAISAHPGGAQSIVTFCGQEATQAFNTKDNVGKPHSSGANMDLSNYFIGNLNQTINNTATKNPTNTSNTSTTTKTSTVPPVTSPTGNIFLGMSEVAKHSSASDCWMVINGKVYNVTSSISAHPGGAGEIIKFCGQEATKAFNTKDNMGRPHSGGANMDLSSYFIGNLNENISTQQIQQKVQSTNTVTPTRRGEDD